MHAAIEHHALLARTEIITVGADLSSARQIDELQNRAPTCQSSAREQSANFVRASQAKQARQQIDFKVRGALAGNSTHSHQGTINRPRAPHVRSTQ